MHHLRNIITYVKFLHDIVTKRGVPLSLPQFIQLVNKCNGLKIFIENKQLLNENFNNKFLEPIQ